MTLFVIFFQAIFMES